MTAAAHVSPTAVGEAQGYADVWDPWPVEAARFGEATTTARRAASDALGSTDVGREWSARVDAAVQGLDAIDQSRMDAWMEAHAASPVPEVYEARLVAAWETHADAGPACSTWEWADEGDELAGGLAHEFDDGETFAASQHDPEVSELTF